MSDFLSKLITVKVPATGTVPRIFLKANIHGLKVLYAEITQNARLMKSQSRLQAVESKIKTSLSF